MVEVQLNDIGTSFELAIVDQDNAVIDVSTVTTKEIKFRKPDGTVLTKAATFLNTGADGIIKYVSVANDLDIEGSWDIQARVIFPGGSTWHSEVKPFQVYGNL